MTGNINILNSFSYSGYSKAQKYVNSYSVDKLSTSAGEDCILASPQCPSNYRLYYNLRTVMIFAAITPSPVIISTSLFRSDKSYPKAGATFGGIVVFEAPVSRATGRKLESFSLMPPTSMLRIINPRMRAKRIRAVTICTLHLLEFHA